MWQNLSAIGKYFELLRRSQKSSTTPEQFRSLFVVCGAIVVQSSGRAKQMPVWAVGQKRTSTLFQPSFTVSLIHIFNKLFLVQIPSGISVCCKLVQDL